MSCNHHAFMKIVPRPEKQGKRWYTVSYLETVAPPLPEHATVVCPCCNWSGVNIRFDVCECHRDGCGYRWRSLLLVGEEQLL